MLAGCASPESMSSASKRKSKEYFAESEYGVKASPRVTSKRSRLPRGGGRDQTGKPYQVKGKWYYPKEDPDYVKVGAASWYGDAFHGRLTANGEIYDMTHLTAAHPTMPLPSYARVINTANGSSVIVRVNDRGPFAHGRIIDLSKRAAEMLDYTHAGVAKVQVEYLGRAPLHGRDEQYLMASYRPGRSDPGRQPADEIAPAVMVAMNGPTPLAGIGSAAPAFPGQARAASSDPVLPSFGPIVPERPLTDPFVATVETGGRLILSYADARTGRASEALDALSSGRMQAAEILASWKRQRAGASDGYIALGTFGSMKTAEKQGRLLGVGRTEVRKVAANGVAGYAVELHPDGRHSTDEMLRTAWANGAPEAILVRD
jgi:rare lipoprotein A